MPSLFPTLPQTGWAHFSPCGQFRYELWRRWEDAPLQRPAVFIGLNPSKADGETDDHTIRRVTTFAKAWGYSSLCMLNLFAFRSTYPIHLVDAADPVGVSNDHHIRAVCAHSGIVIACWGDFSNAFRPIPELWAARAREVWTMLATLGVEIHCLGTTKEGYPRHPSRLGRNVQPTPWEVKF